MGKLCGRLLHITFDMEIEGCMEDVKVRLLISKHMPMQVHISMVTP